MKKGIAVPVVLLLAAMASACDRTPSGLSASEDGPQFTLGSGTDTFLAGALADYTLHNTTGAWSVTSGQMVADSSAKQSVAIRNGLTIANGFVQTETSQSPDGGLVLRFLDKDNYYLMAVRDDSRYGHANIQIHKFYNGVVTNLTSQYDINWPSSTTKTARFEASGNTLSAYLDGVLIAQATDSSFASGGAGLRHHSASLENLTAKYDEFVWGGTTSAFYTDPFNDNTLSSYTRYNPPTAWSVSSGKMSADSTAKHSLAIRSGLTFANGWVETVTSDIPDGGLVLRMQDSANYYMLAIRDDSRYSHSNIQIYEFNAGVETALTAQLDINWSANTSKTVRFQASGSTLSAYVDGVLAAQATDSTFTSGGAGMRSHSASGQNLTSRFDLFRWFW